MGCKTPNIDRLAKEGALFTDWYGQQSCTAGRGRGQPARLPTGTPGPHSQREKETGRCLCAVEYRDHWFWIEDGDMKSKRAFAFMMMLFTLMDTGEKQGLPVLTIPTQ